MVDVFEEVEEELRAARYQRLVQRGWPYAAGAVVLALLVTLGVWGFNTQQQNQQAKASIAYNDALLALATGDLDGADRRFASLSASAPAGYRTLALMQQAGVRVQKRKDEEAVRLLDQAAKAAPDAVLMDIARLKAAYLVMDTHPLSDVETRLQPLTDDSRPFHLQAREALAMARLQAGKPQAAVGDLGLLTLSQDVSEATRTRAQMAKLLVQSGSAAALPSAARATPVMPPAPAAQALPGQAGAQLPMLANAGAAQ